MICSHCVASAPCLSKTRTLRSRAFFLIEEAVVVLGNVPKLHGLFVVGILAAAASFSAGCGSQFEGCKASRTCKPNTGGASGTGGESGGGSETGGTSGASGTSTIGGTSGSPSTGGTSGTSGEGGDSGSSTGGFGDAGGEGGDGGTSTGGSINTGGTSGSGMGGTAGMGGTSGTGPTDTTRPTIVSVTPANNATGVRADTNIVITFSEPMERVATQAAYQSTDLPSGAVAFSWNAESTVLTINPSTDLAYATGGNLSVAARAFALSVTTTAEDDAGNRLASDFNWSFRTLRRITPSIAASTFGPACMNDEVVISCYGGSPSTCNTIDVLFATSGLPADLVAVESANLRFNLTANTGFSSVCQTSPIHVADFTGTMVTTNLGTIANCDAGGRTFSVLASFVDDYQNRATRQNQTGYSLQALGYDAVQGADSFAHFRCSDFKLDIVYIAP